MKIAYLTNQYPHVRHTFIRREIVALESLGVEVVRFSIRDSGRDAVDPADIEEKKKTHSLLAEGKLYVSNLEGKTFVLAASPRYEHITTNDIGEPTYAGLAVVQPMKGYTIGKQLQWLNKENA